MYSRFSEQCMNISNNQNIFFNMLEALILVALSLYVIGIFMAIPTLYTTYREYHYDPDQQLMFVMLWPVWFVRFCYRGTLKMIRDRY